MQTFFRTFSQSFIRPVYDHGVKYYVTLVSMLILLTTVTQTLRLAPALKSELAKSAKEVVQDFPPDLVLTIAPGGVSANKAFPLIAKMPSVLAYPDLKNLAVIDPNGEIGDLEKYNALILINNSYIIVGNGNSVQTASLKDFPVTRIDYSRMHQFSQTLLFIAQHTVSFTAGYFAFTGLVNFFVWRLLYLAVFAFGLWLIYKSVVGTYAKAFQVSLHSVTLPLLISTTLGITGIVIPFPGWFIIIHTIFTFYVLGRFEKHPA